MFNFEMLLPQVLYGRDDLLISDQDVITKDILQEDNQIALMSDNNPPPFDRWAKLLTSFNRAHS